MDARFSVRLMRPEESIEVSRCIYRTYKYTYLNEDLYFPERIEAMNRDGRMISAVAVTDGGEMIGHFALLPRPNGRGAEIGIAVVAPQYRGRGVMKEMLDFLIREAVGRGFIVLFGNAFTMHPISQKANLDFGFRETALQLADVPPGSIRPLSERGLKGAGGVISFFKYLKAPERYRVFLPQRHRKMLKRIYENLGLKRSHARTAFSHPLSMPNESVIHMALNHHSKTAEIEVVKYGRDIEGRVRAKLIELDNKGFNAVYLDLGLKDPLTVWASERLEGLGFFFSGLLPDYSEGDVLRLQYYDTVVDYGEIDAYSPFAKEIVGYVKSLDNKWKALHP